MYMVMLCTLMLLNFAGTSFQGVLFSRFQLGIKFHDPCALNFILPFKKSELLKIF